MLCCRAILTGLRNVRAQQVCAFSAAEFIASTFEGLLLKAFERQQQRLPALSRPLPRSVRILPDDDGPLALLLSWWHTLRPQRRCVLLLQAFSSALRKCKLAVPREIGRDSIKGSRQDLECHGLHLLHAVCRYLAHLEAPRRSDGEAHAWLWGFSGMCSNDEGQLLSILGRMHRLNSPPLNDQNVVAVIETAYAWLCDARAHEAAKEVVQEEEREKESASAREGAARAVKAAQKQKRKLKAKQRQAAERAARETEEELARAAEAARAAAAARCSEIHECWARLFLALRPPAGEQEQDGIHVTPLAAARQVVEEVVRAAQAQVKARIRAHAKAERRKHKAQEAAAHDGAAHGGLGLQASAHVSSAHVDARDAESGQRSLLEVNDDMQIKCHQCHDSGLLIPSVGDDDKLLTSSRDSLATPSLQGQSYQQASGELHQVPYDFEWDWERQRLEQMERENGMIDELDEQVSQLLRERQVLLRARGGAGAGVASGVVVGSRGWTATRTWSSLVGGGAEAWEGGGYSPIGGASGRLAYPLGSGFQNHAHTSSGHGYPAWGAWGGVGTSWEAAEREGGRTGIGQLRHENPVRSPPMRNLDLTPASLLWMESLMDINEGPRGAGPLRTPLAPAGSYFHLPGGSSLDMLGEREWERDRERERERQEEDRWREEQERWRSIEEWRRRAQFRDDAEISGWPSGRGHMTTWATSSGIDTGSFQSASESLSPPSSRQAQGSSAAGEVSERVSREGHEKVVAERERATDRQGSDAGLELVAGRRAAFGSGRQDRHRRARGGDTGDTRSEPGDSWRLAEPVFPIEEHTLVPGLFLCYVVGCSL